MDPVEFFVDVGVRATELTGMDEGQPPRVGNGSARGASTGRIDAEFTAFYRAEHDAQVRRAALLVGSDDAGNDIVHDALVAMLRRWDSIADPAPYLNRAVLNGCRDLGRRRVVDRRAIRKLHTQEAQRPDEMLFDVIGRLPFNQRAAVVMRFYERMTESEIAAALDCKPGSVGPWIHRALTAMRKELS
jgi:RNA polymerase sigma factor (sigma-70 family)